MRIHFVNLERSSIRPSSFGQIRLLSSIVRAACMVLVALIGALGAPSSHAQTSTHEQLISIQSPNLNQSFKDATVAVSVHFYAGANTQTWAAQLDGVDARGFFGAPAGCGLPPCDETAAIPGYLLSNGRNILSVTVSGDDSSVDTDQSEFVYNSANAAGQTPAKRIPGVAVTALALAKGASDLNQVSNYQILIGPGPGFRQRTYTPSGLDCAAGNNSAQVLVLDRETLEPTSDGTSGQACFGNAAALTAFLQSLPAGRLVIANTFNGEMEGLDTSAIGGRNFVKSPDSHPSYSIIGVSGSAEGEAYQGFGNSFGPTLAYTAPLVGSLMLDYSQRYSFVSSQYSEFELLPNQVGGAMSTTGSTIMYNGTPYVGTLTGGGDKGGFFLLEVDRRSNNILSQRVYATNGDQAAPQISELTAALGNGPRSSIVMLATIGQPFSTNTSVNASLFYAINNLGGTGYAMPRLAAALNSGQVPTYSLVSSREFAANQALVVQESNAFVYNPSSGAVQGLLSRDRSNLWTVDVATPEKYVSTGIYKKQTDYGWKTVGFQQPQDWPTWTEAQQKVYSDLTDSNLYVDQVRDELGCADTPCQSIRSFYTGYLGVGDPAPTRIDYASLTYHADRGYTEQDFQSVISQLKTEKGYLRNLQLIYGQFTDTWNSSQTTLQVQLSNVAGHLEETLRNQQAQNILAASQLTKAANIVAAGSSIPVVGIGLSALSATFKAASALTEQGSQIPQEYTIQLDTMINDNQQIGQVLINSNSTFFRGIVLDWGKLQTIGQGYAAGNAPWYMCDECVDQRPPRAAIPIMALGAKRGYYVQLLPYLYTFDTFLQDAAPTPQQLGGRVGGVLKICETPYDQAGSRYLGYPSINVPSTNDLFILTTTTRTFIYGTGQYIPHYPSDGLMNDLFSAPSVTSDGLLAGGAGLTFDKFSSGSNRPINMRNGLRPSDTPCVKGASTASVDPDFTISSPDTSPWVTNAGSVVSGHVLLQELNGFQGTATLACSGQAGGDVCSFSPTGVDFSQGQYSDVTLTITTAPRVTTAQDERKTTALHGATVFAFLLCPLVAIAGRKKRSHLLRAVLALVVTVALCSSLTGCGNSTPTPTPVSPYPITSQVIVTATSGALAHSVTVMLTKR